MQTETWKAIPGYEGRYQVSDLGRVRSLDRILNYSTRGFPANKKYVGRVLKPSASSKGHLKITIDKMNKPIHQLVMLAFIGPRPNATETRHLDGDPKNNCLVNLCYGTKEENHRDLYRTGVSFLLRTFVVSGGCSAKAAPGTP